MNDIDHRPPQDEAGPLPRGMGCLLIGVALFLFLFVFGIGLGLPRTHRLSISDVQAFDGEDGVVLFVGIQHEIRTSGFLQSPPIRPAEELLRIEITGDGKFRRTSLTFDKGLSFNTNVVPIIRMPSGFYLVEQPHMGKPSCRLHRVMGDQIGSLSDEETDEVLREIGLSRRGTRSIGKFAEYDQISEKCGWHRLNQSSHVFGHTEPSVSARHKLQFRVVEQDQSQVIAAEPFPEKGTWSKSLMQVNTKPLKSYQSPRQ